MILIGQYDSSFVRRVGIALRLYDLPFEHRPWSVFGDAERIREINPLTRVPTLVLDTGEALVDSTSILDYLDTLAGPERALHPTAQPERYRVMRVTALAAGLADKTVSLFYELRLHDQASQAWIDRCRTQMLATLQVLEGERSAVAGSFWFGDRITHADIAATASLKHMQDSHPDLVSMSSFPALRRHADFFEAMPVFQEISQPFIPPA
ncbi:glutathione S-transferase family protein [Tianweitania sediminis]|uniref:Glutathione S-transferase family protein n=1 Tax=Tianweitania sediminis TaxID=1502156 RepID=A0A8J7ULG6_9HYPH|nr:glutathione S-transferase family protein [Tianweitania sediminis]MBP0440925.1 glutathione S-transferase family protein [Tianweitania sediminis]